MQLSIISNHRIILSTPQQQPANQPGAEAHGGWALGRLSYAHKSEYIPFYALGSTAVLEAWGH